MKNGDRFVHCLPHPLSFFCWLDNLKGVHNESRGLICWLHDKAQNLVR